MNVRDVMTKDIISVSTEDNVSKVISLIEQYCFREILVIDKKKLKGIVYSKEISKKGITDPTKTKVNSLMRFPPHTLFPEQDINEAAKLIFKIGVRALPVTEKDKVIGVVSMHEIIDFASKSKDFRQTTAESIMSVPEIVSEETDIGAARVLMREKNISRLPIINKNQKLTGVVTIFDLLKAIKPHERMNFYSMSEEKENIMGIHLSVVMNGSPTTVNRKTSLSEIAGLIRKCETDGVIVEENNFPIGVITEKDLIEFYVSRLEQKGIFYQIIGLADEDEFIVSTADRMIRDALQKLNNIHKIQYFVLHVKRYDKTGKVKYSIRTRLLTEKGTFVSKSHAWDLRTAVDKALVNLERIIIKEKQYGKQRMHEILRSRKIGIQW
ncbi:hypothetical protein A3K64_02745 [Candidatus Micrarchaeota archaeon RBG_16_36_9]|nr:MAG: hypothetical protein A3K64_02745 [Candidatus Micrarchaeota archaeon RBG_16_36_9]